MDINPNLNMFDTTKVPVWEQGQLGGRIRPINEDVLFKNFCEVVEVFTKYGIKYAISHGTLLGLVRLGTLIPWDDDIDVTLFTEDHHKFALAEAELRNKGFFIPVRTANPKDVVNPLEKMWWYDFVAIKDGEKIEGWFTDKTDEKYVYDAPRSGLAWPRKFLDNLAILTWRGKDFTCPDFTEEYLVRMYGTFPINEENAHRKYRHSS